MNSGIHAALPRLCWQLYILHLLLPVLAVLLLRLFLALEVTLLLLVELPDLVLKLLPLAHEHINFLRQTVFDNLGLPLLRMQFDRVLLQQSERVHTQVRDARPQVRRHIVRTLHFIDVWVL